MDVSIIIRVLVVVAMVGLAAWFAGSETAFFSLSPLALKRLAKEGHPRAELLRRLASRPRELLNSLLMGNEISDVTASVLASGIFIERFGPRGKWIAIAVMIPIMMLSGEVIPKVSAALNPARFASAVAGPVAVWMRLVAPVRWLADRLIKLISGRAEDEQGRILEEEFLNWVRSSHKEGLVRETEREFIENLIAFEATTLAGVMTPRTDIFALDVHTPVARAVESLRSRHFSRVPVYEDDEDNIIGILHAKDILRERPPNLRSLLRPAHFAPETKKAEAMLSEMQRRRLHMAMVVDEYGGLVGLVTLDDLLEELFGEIYDEHELAEWPLGQKAPGVWTVSPRLSVEEFNERMGTNLPEDEGYDTMGGFLLHTFGRMPTPGEETVFEGRAFRVSRIKGTRVLEIELREPGSEQPSP
ncbi:MAG: hemolysin family protein [Pseudomonadota bacterium]